MRTRKSSKLMFASYVVYARDVYIFDRASYGVINNENTLQLAIYEIEEFVKKTCLLAECDTPIARAAGCIFPHEGNRSVLYHTSIMVNL